MEETLLVSQAPNNSGLTVLIHPLALLNISDHYTRARLDGSLKIGNTTPPVLGALLGTLTGRQIEISNTFEIVFNVYDDTITLNRDLFITRQEQFKQVFPNFDFLGWYSVGKKPSIHDMNIRNQLLEFNEGPLFVLLNPSKLNTSKSIPISIYETTMELEHDQALTKFIKVPFRFETGEAERIAVDYIANTSISSSSDIGIQESSLIPHLIAQRNSIKMLDSKIEFLLTYLNDVKNGQENLNHKVLREISSLTSRLPIMDSTDFKNEYMTEYTDVLLSMYLSTSTKGANAMNELMDKFSMTSTGRGNTKSYLHWNT